MSRSEWMKSEQISLGSFGKITGTFWKLLILLCFIVCFRMEFKVYNKANSVLHGKRHRNINALKCTDILLNFFISYVKMNYGWLCSSFIVFRKNVLQSMQPSILYNILLMLVIFESRWLWPSSVGEHLCI